MTRAVPPGRAPPGTSDATKLAYIVFGVAACLLVAALAFLLGQTAANPVTRGLEEKLALVRTKATSCAQDRDRLRAKQKREPDYRKSPAYKIQWENDHLADENNELMMENEGLREDKVALEEALVELHSEIERNSVINAEENKKLDHFVHTGNMSAALKEFIEEQSNWGSGVDKDELMYRLIAELQWKKQQFQRCSKDIVATTNQLEQAKKRSQEAAAAAAAKKTTDDKPKAEVSKEQLAALIAQLQSQEQGKGKSSGTAEKKTESQAAGKTVGSAKGEEKPKGEAEEKKSSVDVAASQEGAQKVKK